MQKLWIAVAAVATAVGLPGCVVHTHGHGHGHSSAAVGVAHCDHHYSFYPDYHAYHCGGCGWWWAFNGSAWVEHKSRPSHVHVTPQVVVIKVAERGPEPWKHHANHMKKVPPGWKTDKPGKGPPPGRGWKKDKD